MGTDIFKDNPELSKSEIEALAKKRLTETQEKIEVADEVYESEEKIKEKLALIEKFKNRKNSNLMPQEGFKNLPIDLLASAQIGISYPTGTSIQIRPASVKEIRHYSSIDENDFLSADDKMDYIIEQCARIYFGEKKMPHKEIYEIDKIYLILAIRELTFAEKENKLEMSVECPNCGHKESIEITKDRVVGNKLDEKLLKYYNSELGKFVFTTKTEGDIPLKLPNIGMTSYLKNYARLKSYSNKFFDESFLKMLLYLDVDYTKLTDKKINEINNELGNWSIPKLSIFYGLMETLETNILPMFNYNCPSCGFESKHPITFRDGYKSLFLITNVLDELV